MIISRLYAPKADCSTSIAATRGYRFNASDEQKGQVITVVYSKDDPVQRTTFGPVVVVSETENLASSRRHATCED
jgi:hypothetical protein